MKKPFFLNALILIFFFFSPAFSHEQNDIFHSQEEIDRTRFEFLGQADSLSFWGDKLDLIRDRNNFKSVANFPRGRYQIAGKKWPWFYKLSFDVAQNRLRDLYLRYDQYEKFRIIIGQGRVPSSFRFLCPNKDMAYMEHALPTIAFVPGFRMLLQTQFFPDPFTFTYGLFWTEANNTIQENQVKGHMPLAYNLRVTYVPIHTEKAVLHLGAASFYQKSDSLHRFRFRSFPEVATYHNHFLVNTGFIQECRYYIGNEFELAIMRNSFLIEGEYYRDHVTRYFQNSSFQGFLIGMDYFLTGEHYNYDFKLGSTPTMIRPYKNSGAWQVTFRCSKVDLESNKIKGGKETNLTFGLNWIPSAFIKIMLNYIVAEAKPSENSLDRHLNIVALRCQLTSESK